MRGIRANGESGSTGLVELLARGHVFYNVSGSTPTEALEDLIGTVPAPKDLDRAALLKAVLEREALMPTAVGHGIAIPHPRSPLLAREEDQSISVGFLQRPIDWQAFDGKPVGTVILILSATPRLHLGILSRLSYLCQWDVFRGLLAQRAPEAELAAAIREAERNWK